MRNITRLRISSKKKERYCALENNEFYNRLDFI